MAKKLCEICGDKPAKAIWLDGNLIPLATENNEMQNTIMMGSNAEITGAAPHGKETKP